MMKLKTSSTSLAEPRKMGLRWWIDSGTTSKIGTLPVEAFPPACSIKNAIGLHSYNNRSWKFRSKKIIHAPLTILHVISLTLPFGFWEVAGYKKTPPYLIVRCTSATMLPTYLQIVDRVAATRICIDRIVLPGPVWFSLGWIFLRLNVSFDRIMPQITVALVDRIDFTLSINEIMMICGCATLSSMV